MNKALLLYATNSGNTYYAAQRIADALKEQKMEVDVRSVGDVKPEILNQFDTIILGSCTWNRHTETAKYEEGQLQDQMQRFVDAIRTSGEKFAKKKFAVFGLGDSEYMKFCAAADHLENFVNNIQGQKIGETLRIDSFPKKQEEKIDAWARSLVPLLSPSPSPAHNKKCVSS